MKRVIIVLALLIFASNCLGEVQGTIKVIDGKRVLFVWGNHEERGYAHGYIEAENIKNLIDKWLVKDVCAGEYGYYDYIRALYKVTYTVAPKYETEAQAMLTGMRNKGIDLYTKILDREIDEIDILMLTAVFDLSQLVFPTMKFEPGCVSMSSWGAVTRMDPVLMGNTVITRFLDWNIHPALLDAHLMIVHMPSEQEEQKWISVGFSGFIGTVSAVNQTGAAAFLNGCTLAPASRTPAHPMMLALRNGLEMKDFDKNNTHDTGDIAVATSSKRTGGTAIIQAVQKSRSVNEPTILECCPKWGVKTRCCQDNNIVPGQNLVATNHFRCSENPEYCYRYKRIVDQLYVDMNVSPESSWELLANTAGQKYRNIHAIQYLPEEGRLKWATAKIGSPAYDEPISTFSLTQLFNMNPKTLDTAQLKIKEKLKPNFPNPFNAQTHFAFYLEKTQLTRLKIFDMLGREITSLVDATLPAGEHRAVWDAGNLPSGIYIYQLETPDYTVRKKMTLLK